MTIIISGRPRLLNGCKETSDAVLEAYLPGPMGGQAVAEIIQGIVVPSGRIPFSYPKYPGAVPYPYHHKPGNKCTNPDNGFEYITCEVIIMNSVRGARINIIDVSCRISFNFIIKMMVLYYHVGGVGIWQWIVVHNI